MVPDGVFSSQCRCPPDGHKGDRGARGTHGHGARDDAQSTPRRPGARRLDQQALPGVGTSGAAVRESGGGSPARGNAPRQPGLRSRAAAAVRVPAVLGCGGAGRAWLARWRIEFGFGDGATEALLGTRLALQHRRIADTFGGGRDNTIGSTPQINSISPDWVEFWRAAFAPSAGACCSQWTWRTPTWRSAAVDRLGVFFDTYRPAASLLHGDLWGGNWGADRIVSW